MAAPKPKARRYSDEDRSDAVAALCANGGNVKRTARELGIPEKTLANWAKGDRHPEAAAAAEEKKGPLADRLEQVAWQLADAIPGKLDAAPLQQVATALGIVVDKLRLLRNEPTSISKTQGAGTDDLRDLSDDELERRAAELRGRIEQAAAAAGPRRV